MGRQTRILAEGIYFGEGPRWRDGRLWFSDFHAHAVKSVSLAGDVRTEVELDDQPSGLGWMPDGSLLIVSMVKRQVLRRFPDGRLALHADLGAVADFHCNDMVVDDRGRAYIGNFGFDLHAEAPFRPAELVLVPPDGPPRIVADDLAFPNGCVITPDGRTLVVGESGGARLTAFTVAADGSLGERRVWALLESAVPDGICLDAEGAIWVASPVGNEVLRVQEGGAVLDRVRVSTIPFACMLGGPDRRTLFVATAETHQPERVKLKPSGRIEIATVRVPGAGRP